MKPDVTICCIIEQLYMEAIASGNVCQQHDLRQIYHMAKSMNKKLIEYKTGIVETWTDKEVDGRLDEIKEKVERCIKAK